MEETTAGKAGVLKLSVVLKDLLKSAFTIVLVHSTYEIKTNVHENIQIKLNYLYH